jgi:hypothetical protein
MSSVGICVLNSNLDGGSTPNDFWILSERALNYAILLFAGIYEAKLSSTTCLSPN